MHPLAPKILEGARALVATRPQWTQRAFARDADGEPTDLSSPEAVCFCLVGATERSNLNIGAPGEACYEALAALEKAALEVVASSHIEPISAFNDMATHIEVLAVLDRAITLAKEAA